MSMLTAIEINDELSTLDLPDLPSLTQTVVERKVKEAPEDEQVDLTDEEFAELTAEAARVDAALEALNARKEELKVTARRLDYGTNKRASSLGSVRVDHNSQFDKEKFVEEKPYDEYNVEKYVMVNENGNDVVRQRMVFPNRELYKIEPDRTAIKKKLSEDEWKAFYYEGTKKVSFNR